MKNLISIFCLILGFGSLFSQESNEQRIGIPPAEKTIYIELKGTVTSKSDGNTIAGADLTVREYQTQNILSTTKTVADGQYSIIIPKGLELDIRAQAPQYFYDAKKVNISIDNIESFVKADFQLPSELQLRINFPSNKHDSPYRFILDENGLESFTTWEEALEQVAEDLIKYQEFLNKVMLVGHTDDVGKSDYNVKLGERRVEFMMNELIQRGVNEKLLEIRSAGKSELLEQLPNEDRESWRKRCRRVVLSKVMK